MTRILASDILIADVIVKLAGNPALKALVAKYQLQPGSKTAVSLEQFQALSAAVEGHECHVTPGGSSANVLTTLNKLYEKRLAIDFIGIAGEGPSSRLIRDSLTEAGIRLLPESLPPGAEAKIAVSYVMLLENGQRIIATWPGNARRLLVPEMIDEAEVEASDVVFLQGSLWWKMEKAYADRLLALSRKHQKELWLALPTYSRFGNEQSDLFRNLVLDADLVLGNEEELSRIWEGGLGVCLAELQAAMRRHKQGRRPPVGFITCGDKGAAVVTADNIETVLPAQVAPYEVVNTLGAGDMAFAGFAFGYLERLTHADCARIAMALAGEKLRVNGPRLADPWTALRRALPDRFL